MILDKEFKGVLDQGAGCLVVYDEADDDQTYEMALGTLKQISHVVDSLYQQVRCISAKAYRTGQRTYVDLLTWEPRA